MEHFFSLILLLLLFAAGVFNIYMLIDFFEYLKRFHSLKWEALCFERVFGIARDDFFLYPVKPNRFLPFLFSNDNINDAKVLDYKKKIKMSFLGALGIFVIYSLLIMLT